MKLKYLSLVFFLIQVLITFKLSAASAPDESIVNWDEYKVTALLPNELPKPNKQNLRCEFVQAAMEEYSERLSNGKDLGFLTYYLTLPVHESSQRVDYGFSFNYNGPLEANFLQDIKAADPKETEILLLAVGSGRVALDSLSVTKNAHIVVNDLLRENLLVCQKNIAKYGKILKKKDPTLPSVKERVALRSGDAFSVLKSTKDNSVDFLHSAHFIHFLSPEKLEQYFEEVARVLKPGGKCYTFWQPHEEGLPERVKGHLFSNTVEQVKELANRFPFKKDFIAKKYSTAKVQAKVPGLTHPIAATVFAKEIIHDSKENATVAAFVFQKNKPEEETPE